MAFQLTASAFPDQGTIPTIHTCDGADLSPALEWSGQPAGTQSFALIMDDPDAPSGTWTHWILFDIPGAAGNLAQGYKTGGTGKDGTNSFKREGYGGPCPPKGHGPHRYYFHLYALDTPALGIRDGAERPAVEKALHGHVLAEAQYMGRYERN